MGHPHYSRLQKGGKRQLSHSPPTGKTGAVEGLIFPNRAKEGQMAAFCLGDFTEKSKIRLSFWEMCIRDRVTILSIDSDPLAGPGGRGEAVFAGSGQGGVPPQLCLHYSFQPPVGKRHLSSLPQKFA